MARGLRLSSRQQHYTRSFSHHHALPVDEYLNRLSSSSKLHKVSPSLQDPHIVFVRHRIYHILHYSEHSSHCAATSTAYLIPMFLQASFSPMWDCLHIRINMHLPILKPLVFKIYLGNFLPCFSSLSHLYQPMFFRRTERGSNLALKTWL